MNEDAWTILLSSTAYIQQLRFSVQSEFHAVGGNEDTIPLEEIDEHAIAAD